MNEILFTKDFDNNKIYPNKQLAYSYFLADYRMANRVFEIRPLTLGHLFYALSRNYTRIIYWGFLRGMWKLGFIYIDKREKFSWRQNFFVIPRG